MAGKSPTSGKYKGALVNKTNVLKLQKGLKMKLADIAKALVEQLTYIGEECVRIARENGSYNDITGNLRSSIGYVVLQDGKPVKQGAPKQYDGKAGNGAQGVTAAENLLKRLQAQYPRGIVLIICAGMHYAAYVENIYHKDVLTTADLKAQSLLKDLMQDMSLGYD